VFYAWDITIPADTGEASPVTQLLKLTRGIIKRIDIRFPDGCHRMVKVRIFRYESQLVPLSRDEWVTGDGETVPTEPFYELLEAPYQLKFVGCSPGTKYKHTVTVRIQLLGEEEAAPWRVIKTFIELLRRMMGLR